MLSRRNAVEVWHVARIEKCGGDLFLHNIDPLKVSYVTTSLKLHTVKSYKQVQQQQNTRDTNHPRMQKSHSKRHELVDCPLFTIARKSMELY